MPLPIRISDLAAAFIRGLAPKQRADLERFLRWLGSDLEHALGDPRIRVWQEQPDVTPFRFIAFVDLDILYAVEEGTLYVVDVFPLGSRPVP